MEYKYALARFAFLSLLFSGVAFSQDGKEGDLVNSDAPASGEHKQSPAEALNQDLKLVAQARGWTLAEAKAHWEKAEEIGQIAAKLAAQHPDKYVGSVLSSRPGYVPSLYIKGELTREVHELVSSADFHINIEDDQPWSLVELEERSRKIHKLLAEQGYDNIATSIDFQQGGVIHAEVTQKDIKSPSVLTQEAARVQIANALKASFPQSLQEGVTLTVSAEPVARDFYAYGGMEAWSNGTPACTTGWAVQRVRGTFGETGVTTAGHCNGIDQIHHAPYTHDATHEGQHRGEWGDIEWKTTGVPETAEFYATATSIRDVTSIEPRAGISVGESICFYGRFSDSRDCSLDVAATSVSCTVSGVFNDRLVRMNGNSAIPGDSGGGWSFNFKAYGSVKGICGGGAVFSVADLYDEALGVSVRLQPSGSWTAWLDRDDASGTGDWESLNLFPASSVCASPTNVQARRVGTSTLITTTGSWPEFFHRFGPSHGLVCRNDDQTDGSCNDYEVRFLCP